MKYSSHCVRQQGPGRWRGVLKYKDESGAWRTVTRKLEATGKRAAETECKAWFNAMNAEDEQRAAGRAAGPAQTLADYLEDYVTGKVPTVEPSTVYGYRSNIKNHVRPYSIGSVPIDELTPSDFRSWMAEALEDYGRTTVNRAFTIVRSAMRQAVSDGTLIRNPTDGVKGPGRNGASPNSVVKEQRGRLAAALEAAAQTPDVVGMRIAFYTGMREGEVCALRWRNVDLESQTISVREAVGKAGGKLYLKEPKTRGSRRTIPMPDTLAGALRARRIEMMEQAMAAGVAFSPDMFVIGGIDKDGRTGDYRFMNPHVLWERWRAMADLLGLRGTQGRPVTYHDLRHTYATVGISEGVDVKTVSSTLGHANAAMTLNIYADADPEAKRRAADIVAAALERDATEPGQVARFRPTGTGE